MLFNPDSIKQAIEECFSHKHDNHVYPPLKSNNNDVQWAHSPKYLGLVLDFTPKLNEHVNNKIDKCNNLIGMWSHKEKGRKSMLKIFKILQVCKSKYSKQQGSLQPYPRNLFFSVVYGETGAKGNETFDL